MKKARQTPLIVTSPLTKPARWFVLTRYREKEGVSLKGEKTRYLVASEKFDVTDQMMAIFKERRRMKART